MSQHDAAEWYEFNKETIEALTEDGSDISLPHTIEHHFASSDFDALEKAAVDAFKAGFEVIIINGLLTFVLLYADSLVTLKNNNT